MLNIFNKSLYVTLFESIHYITVSFLFESIYHFLFNHPTLYIIRNTKYVVKHTYNVRRTYGVQPNVATIYSVHCIPMHNVQCTLYLIKYTHRRRA